jgi:hypothetical protein
MFEYGINEIIFHQRYMDAPKDFSALISRWRFSADFDFSLTLSQKPPAKALDRL